MESRDFAPPSDEQKFPDSGKRAPETLRHAVRRARLDDAERTKAVAELRGAEIARLEMLRDALRPVAAQIPKDIDIFDISLMPTERSRLFIDMIGFVEMGHDRRTYRFVQDTRHGRVVIAESERMEPIVGAVTDYIARRLIEREKALASDRTLEQAARVYAGAQDKIAARRRTKIVMREPAAAPVIKPRPLSRAFGLFLQILGFGLLVAAIAFGGFAAWRHLAMLARHAGG